MKKYYLTIFLFTCVLINLSYSQEPDIAYIIPDIGSPGMNVYVEIIAPYDKIGSFGTDGFYMNHRGDPVWIELINSSDSTMIVFGPLVVSWNGRMISTQVFVHPSAQPNTWDWETLQPQFRIRFRVQVNNQPSNESVFFVVSPFNFGDKRSNTERVIGAGTLGKRSFRGAMIVDSMVLADAAYTVSTNDNYAITEGNEGYLPFILLSKGKISGGTNTTLSVNGQLRNAGPGGGGGGGRFCDRFVGSLNGDDGGDGYTGGGPGGYNIATGGGGYKNNGKGTGSSGDGLNGVPGSKKVADTYGWETSGGGTGHPFGESGIGCSNGYNCVPEGKYGGGSGESQNLPGGCGGFATAGSSTNGINGGKIHGNDMVVPIAGGSGASSGNPNPPLGNDCAGSGGGGGGALNLFGKYIENLQLTAKGGDGANGHDQSDGGGGSGGYTGIMTKLGFSDIGMFVEGGSGSGTRKGGAGRIRYDSPKFLNAFNSGPAEASRYRGITTDTSNIVTRKFTLTGSRQDGRTVRAFIKPEHGTWEELSGIVYSGSDWSLPFDLSGTDTLYYFAAIQEVQNPSSADFIARPRYILSQAAANIFILDLFPIIAGDTLRRIKITDCPMGIIQDTARITNNGTSDLEIELAGFRNNKPGFRIISPLGKKTIPPGDTVEIIISYEFQTGDKDSVGDVLIINHNDFKGRKNPWEIEYKIKVDSIRFESWDVDRKILLGDLILENVCPGEETERTFAVINKSSIPITFDSPVIIAYQSKFEASIIGNAGINPGDSAWIKVKFKGDSNYTGTYITAVIIRAKECDYLTDTVNVIVKVNKPDLVFIGNGAFPDTKIGESSTIQLRLRNNGTTSTYIQSLPSLPAEFSIIDAQPPIPPSRFLNVGEDILLTLRYSPTDEIDDSFLLRIGGISIDTACVDTAEIQITGRGIVSEVVRSTDSIYFGVLAWCGAVQDSVIIKNVGAADLRINSASIEGPDKDNFAIAQGPNIPTFVSPGDSVIFFIKFIALQGPEGVKNAVLRLGTDDPHNLFVEVKLSGEKELLKIVSNPPSIDFGQIPIGIEYMQTITLTNNGTFDWHINQVLSSNQDIVVTPPASFLAGKGGTADFEAKVKLSQPGITNSIITFIFDTPCPDTFRINVRSEGLEARVQLPDTLDFGILAPCESKDSGFTIRSIGQAPLSVDSIWFEGPYGGLFKFNDNPAPDSLQPGELLEQLIKFDPSGQTDGIKYADCYVLISMNGSQVRYKVVLIGNKQSGLLTYPNPLDFGDVAVGSQFSLKLKVKNIGLLNIDIQSIIPPLSAPIFTINPASLSRNLIQGDSVEFDVVFTPPAEQTYRDSIIFNIMVGTCNDTRVVQLIGKGVPGDSVIAWITPDTLVMPNLSDFRMPLFVKRRSSGDVLNNITLKAEIGFDASIFYPIGLSRGKILKNEVISRERILGIEVSGVDIADTANLITEIIGYTLLGENDSTAFKWISPEWIPKSRIRHTEWQNGLLRLTICRQGGDRLLKSNVPMSILITPIPAKDEVQINLSILEKGIHKLELITTTGQSYKLHDWYADPVIGSDYSFKFDLSSYSNGIYYIKLSSPDRSKFEKLILIK